MKKAVVGLVAVFVGGTVGLLAFYQQPANAQEPDLKPTYGSKALEAGFLPDPFSKKLVAGGYKQTDKGGVKAWIADAPDFILDYTPGEGPLTIHVDSACDTTLLIRTPNGSWVADDDSGGNLNPLIRFPSPAKGKYYIWVGTYGKETAPATLLITERKVQER